MNIESTMAVRTGVMQEEVKGVAHGGMGSKSGAISEISSKRREWREVFMKTGGSGTMKFS